MGRHPIPDEALKDSGAIIGRIGSGKTYAAKGIVERVLREQSRVCVIDPTGVWWGLRSSADGKAPAFPVVVFGGEHADVKIADTSGIPLATTIAHESIAAIIDVSEFTIGQRVRLMTAFLDTLYFENRAPLILVVDEADMFAPQRPMPDQTVMFSRMEQIIRRGRVRGFRPWLITQRPAELHKSVLSQAATLVAMQLTAPQDRDAVGAWIEGQADRDQGKKVLAELPRLKKGEGYVWSPSHNILERVKFPAITTFDSSRTPEHGEAMPAVEMGVAVNLEKIRAAFAETEKALEDDDPAILRRKLEDAGARIAQLEGGVGALEAERTAEAELRAFREGIRTAWSDIQPALARVADGVMAAHGAVTALLDTAANEQAKHAQQIATVQRPRIESTRGVDDVAPTVVRKPHDPRQQKTGGAPLAKAERAMLIVLAQQHPKPCTRSRLSILTGYSGKSSSFANALSGLRAAGYIEGGRGDDYRVTATGLKALGSFEPLPTGRALRTWWIGKLPKCEATLLDIVMSAHPASLSRSKVAELSGYSPTSSSFANGLSKLRTLDLIRGRGDDIVASPDLFR